MRINVHFNPSIKHHKEWGEVFYEGLKRHNLKPNHIAHYGYEKSDLSIVWSYHKKGILYGAKHHLILERGYIDRYNYSSVSFNGLHNISEDYTHSLNTVKDGWEIERSKFNKGKICVIGQVPNDASLWGEDIIKWSHERCEALSKQHEVIFKPHPLDKTEYNNFPCEVVRCDLEGLYNHIRWFVTYSSTVGVDAIMKGCVASAEHEGSMIYNYNVSQSPEVWLKWLSHRQWSKEQFRSGEFWEYFNEYFKNKK